MANMKEKKMFLVLVLTFMLVITPFPKLLQTSIKLKAEFLL